MCGIAGILQFEPSYGAEVLRRLSEAMAGALRHRGPDDEGAWASDDGRCSLAHRRLSIIDLSPAGRQPMSSADGRAVISFNGEIYNYLELRPDLEACGRPFRTRTDTEVLLEAVRAWGALAFPRLDGMYAFALYDLERRELWLGRDPFGEKPLYYLNDGKRLAFASELHALQRLPFFDAAVSEEALAEYLCFQYVGAPRTLYRSVAKLPPGCFLRAGADGRIVIQRYFEFSPGLEAGEPGRSLDDLADELEEILVRSIRRRLISDVPLGAFLSGGVDSSTVCALVRRRLSVPLETFSIGWVDSAESEHAQARRYAERIGTEHHEKLLAPEATDFLLHAGDYLDEPNGDSSCLPTFLLSRFAREHVTVAVSGDGGDEMFGGYGRYLVASKKERRALRQGRPPGTGRLYYSGMILIFDDDDLRELFGRLPGELSSHLDRLRQFVDQGQGRLDLLMRMRKTDVDHYLPGAVLAKVDRMSMQHSLEVRTPFLSIELARFAEKLPTSALLHDGRGKVLLKHLAARYLPREWLDLPKQGFGLPLKQAWGQRQLLDVVGPLLESDASAVASVIGRQSVARFLARQRDPARTHLYQLWAIGVLESYLRNRPTVLPAFDEAPELCRLEVPAIHPAMQRLAREIEQHPADVVLFCRDGVPAWWRAIPGTVTVAAPFAAGTTDGLRFVRVEWTNRHGRGLSALEGKIASPAVAVFVEPGAADWLTPEFCERLGQLGVTSVALAPPDESGTRLLDLASYRDMARQCRSAWWAPGLRVGHLGRRIRPSSGQLFRSRWPLAAKLSKRRRQADQYALAEGRRPLLLGETELEDIRDFGTGRFRVDARRIWLSSTDNSDPRRNRRRYRLIDLRKRGIAPWWNKRIEPFTDSEHLQAVSDFIDANRAAADREGPRPGDTIALITSSLHAGGAERQWIYLGRGLVSRGFRVVLFVFDLGQENAHYLPLAQQAALEVRDLSRPASFPDSALAPQALDGRALGLAAFAPHFLRRDLWRLTRELRAIRADYVACQLDGPNVCGGLAGLLAGARGVLLSFRNVNPSNFSYLQAPWYLPYYRVLQRSPRVVLSGNSRFGNDDYAAWMGVDPARIRTIRNGFSAEEFAGAAADDRRTERLRKELGITPGTRLVSGLFRLSEEKDPETFLEVARRLVRAREDVVVAQAGSGPRLAGLRREVDRLGLAGRIRVLGRRRDAAALLRASQLLLMTSKFEGLPNVLLEAQYMGVPIVATTAGGTAEAIVEGETGLLAAPGDVAALTHFCLELLDDPERREGMGRRGRRWVEERFSVDAFVDATLAALAQP